jgi:hypothetical protein
MIRKVAAWRQVRVVSKDLSDLEDSRGRPAVSFFFAKAWLVLTGDSRSPRETILAEQDGKRSALNLPITAVRALE